MDLSRTIRVHTTIMRLVLSKRLSHKSLHATSGLIELNVIHETLDICNHVHQIRVLIVLPVQPFLTVKPD